jgi:transposase
VKTDCRDARKLARLLAGGLLEPISVRSPELEAAGDLVGAREDGRLGRMRDRRRLSKFCLRHGLRPPGLSWGVARRTWLAERRFAFAAQRQTLDSYLHAVDLVDARIEQLERSMRETAGQRRWRLLVALLRCLRGIDTHTALAPRSATSTASAPPRSSWPSWGSFPRSTLPASSGRQGSITKVGNQQVRRLLVESAWHARRRPKVGYALARRQRGQEAAVIERAWRCQQRLYQRWQRMAGRGKPHQKIVVACARELAGFIWAIATEQPLRAG